MALWAGGILMLASLLAGHAAPPEFMTYQGFLVDGNGNPVAPTTPVNHQVTFRIFTASTGGTRLWSEQQIVTVDKGSFSVVLGEGTPVNGEAPTTLSSAMAGANNANRYMSLSVTINGVTTEMLPRLRLLPAPYAFNATTATQLINPTAGTPVVSYLNNRVEVAGNFAASGVISGNGSGLTGLTAAQIPQLSATVLTSGLLPDARLSANVALRAGGNAFAGNQTISGNVGLGTLGTAFPLTIGNNSLGDKISLWGQSGNSYGFGIAGGLLQIHTDNSGGNIGFGYGSSASMTENMRITGTGNVGIRTATPADRLQIGEFSTGESSYLSIRSGGGNLHRTGIKFRHFNDTIGFNIESDEHVLGNGLNIIRYPAGAPVSAMFIHRFSGNVGINTTNPTSTLLVNGSVGVSGANTLQLGAGVPGKEPAAGTIGYQAYTPGALDIVGAGNTVAARRIKFWSEGGATFAGTNGITMEGPNGRYAKLSRDVNGLVLEANNTRNGVFGKAIWDGDDNLDGYSDRRLKKDIVDAEPVLDRLMQVQVRRFHWTNQVENDPKKFGVIAQELKPLFPDLVGRADAVEGQENLMTVKSGAFGLIAAKAVQELKHEKDTLQKEVQALKDEVLQLKQMVQSLAAVRKQAPAQEGANVEGNSAAVSSGPKAPAAELR